MSGTRNEFSDLETLYLPIAGAVFALIVVALAFAIVRYRARPGHSARPTIDHYGVDAVVALVIAAIVVVLLVRTFATNDEETALAKRPDFRVDALGFKWGWQFTYPSLPGIVDRSRPNEPAVLHVPSGVTVQFTLRTLDVVHALWIPDLRFKRDAWPKQVRRFDMTFPAGMADGVGHCAQYCGLEHSDMVFTVDAMPPARFRAWSRRAVA